MNIDQDVVHHLPREQLLRVMREARKTYGLSDDYVPEQHATSEDITLMIEDLCREYDLEFDPAHRTFGPARLPNNDGSVIIWEEPSSTTIGEVISDDIEGP